MSAHSIVIALAWARLYLAYRVPARHRCKASRRLGSLSLVSCPSISASVTLAMGNYCRSILTLTALIEAPAAD